MSYSAFAARLRSLRPFFRGANGKSREFRARKYAIPPDKQTVTYTLHSTRIRRNPARQAKKLLPPFAGRGTDWGGIGAKGGAGDDGTAGIAREVRPGSRRFLRGVEAAVSGGRRREIASFFGCLLDLRAENRLCFRQKNKGGPY